MNKLSLVIPCYNEEDNIGDFFSQSSKIFKDLQYEIEYIFVNDGSDDRTKDEIGKVISLSHGKEFTIIGIDFSRNFGKESAILAGLEQATGDYISIIDVDLQQNPKYIIEMLKILELNINVDMVACYQRERSEGKMLSYLKMSFYKLINQLSYVEFRMNASDFRIMRKKVKESIINLPEYHRFSKGIFSWVGFNTEYIPYDVENRKGGKTSWSFFKLLNYAINGIISFSVKPLKLSVVIGSLMSSLSFIYLVVVIFQKIFNQQSIPGYATIISLILITSGLQMLLLGVMGEYIAQIFIQVKNRPKYIIKNIRTSREKIFLKENDV